MQKSFECLDYGSLAQVRRIRRSLQPALSRVVWVVNVEAHGIDPTTLVGVKPGHQRETFRVNVARLAAMRRLRAMPFRYEYRTGCELLLLAPTPWFILRACPKPPTYRLGTSRAAVSVRDFSLVSSACAPTGRGVIFSATSKQRQPRPLLLLLLDRARRA